MQHGMTSVAHASIDPIAFFIVAIILFNVVSSIVKGLKKAAGRAMSSSDAEAQKRLTQSLTRTPNQLAAERAAELGRLRKALLASAGLSDMDANVSQASTVAVATQPPYAAASSAIAQSTAVAAAAPLAPSMPSLSAPASWTLQSPGMLMTLESATTAFDRIAAPGTPGAAAQSDALAAVAPSDPAILQGPDSGMNLFVASAIIGPCAAFRPSGHTPGGW
jgi:hypothetical protein